MVSGTGRTATARAVAETVTDPELPMLTLADLGVLREVAEHEGAVTVSITPTYTGCPALDAMRDDLVHALHQAGFGHVEVRGYTDRIGSVAHNLQLSQRRADTVKALLVRQGIPADRIDAIGFGMQDPITTHCSDSLPRDQLITCLQPDRRVEIVTFARPGRRYGVSPR